MRNYLITALCGLLCATLALGCDSKDGGGGDQKEAARKPLSALFNTQTVSLVGPLAKVTLGMSEDAAKKAAPELFESGLGLESADYEAAVTFGQWVDHDAKVLQSVSVRLPDDKAEAVVTAAWGTPVKAKIGTSDRLIWWNEAEGLRATLEGGRLTLEKYLPLKTFLGDGKETFGFEKPQAVVGATPEQLTKAYGAAFDNANDTIASLRLPVLEFGRTNTKVELVKDEGKIREMKMWLPFGDDKAKVMAALAAKFGGEPKEVKTSGPYATKRLMFNDNVEVKEQKDKYFLRVEAPKAAPAAEGDAPPTE